MNYFKKIMAAVLSYEGVLLLSLLTFANAQNNICRDGANSIIGSDNQGEYGAERVGGRLYLNTDNPAPCNGFITQLKYCYYPPESDDESQIFDRVYFAIYRRRQRGRAPAMYQRQGEPVCLGGLSGGEFSCTTLSIPSISVEEGDIIGACLPGMNSLDIVSAISDDSEVLLNADLGYVVSGCSSIDDIRGTVVEHNIIVQRSRMLHLYAKITSNTGGETTSDPASCTAPAVTDRPMTEPDSTGGETTSELASSTAPAVTDRPMTEPDSNNSIANTGGETTSEPASPTTPAATDRPMTDEPDNNNSIANTGGETTSEPASSTAPTVTDRPMTEPDSIANTGGETTSESASSTAPGVTDRPMTEPDSNNSIANTGGETTSEPASSTASPVTDRSMTEPDSIANTGVSSRSDLESTLPTMTTVTAGPQNLEQGSLSTVATVIIVIVVLVFVVLTAVLGGILARKYKKRRYCYYPAFKHTILEEDESTYSQSSTIARFDNVLYSNYSETVQIQDAKNSDQVYDNSYSSVTQPLPEPQPLENTYSEVQEKIDSDSYSYAVVSGEVNPRLPEQRPYDPNRESVLRVFCAPASKESDLYAQLKLCGVKNIRRDTIEATESLGSGQFGDVKKGVWRNEKLKVPVALKTLKEGSQQVDKVKFLQEAAIMAQFSHPNVAVLYGVVSKGEPIMLVVELVEKGSLLGYLAFLKENNDSVHLANLPNVLLNFSRQVALGMCYLSERGFVHRDLAARNILVSNDDICKIADFGMSRDLADENYYVSQGGKIPVKWTAPEAINYKKYSTASDVWSYGCLLYEIWSLGHKPYENLSNLQVIRHLELGERLSPPPGCPRKIYELMILCWNPEVAFRPKFSDLALMLVGDRKEVLGIPQEDLATHPVAGVLGASLEAGEGMYLDLQNRYVFN